MLPRRPRLTIPIARPALPLLIMLAALSVVVETTLVIHFQTHPYDEAGIVIVALVGVALLVNFVAGVAFVRGSLTERRREANMAAELARLLLRTGDLRSALDQAGEHLAQALSLPFATLELGEVAGDDRRWAIPLCDGDTVLGTLLVPAGLPAEIHQRLQQRVVPSLEALLAAACERERITKALEQFFDLSSDLLTVAGKHGLIRVNPAFEQTLGYTLDDLDGVPLDLVVPSERDRIKKDFEALMQGRPVRFENQAIRRDGARRWIEWSVAPHGDFFYAVGRDVTERRREQDQLRQAQTALEASRDQLASLAAQQAALRRVATLVARGVSPDEVFLAVAQEMNRCLNVEGAAVSRYDGDAITMLALADVSPEVREIAGLGERFPLEGDNVSTRVLRTGRAARMDSQDHATGPVADKMRQLGVRSLVAVPIVVGGQVWGTATAGATGPEPLPADTEARIADFTDLVSTAIANAAAGADLAASRDQLSELAEHQTALRRVATLVAKGLGPAHVFDAVTQELRRCLHTSRAALYRYESGAEVTLLASSTQSGLGKGPVGERLTTEGENLAAMVLRTGGPARQDSLENATGSIAAAVRELGVRAAVGAPIIVDEKMWGLAVVSTLNPQPLPPDTESRVSDFAELVATAIANAAARAELQTSRDHLSVLATQQTALRRVATLVARGVGPSEVFSAVAEEMARCLDVNHAQVLRYETGDAATIVASYAGPGELSITVGERVGLEGDNVAASVLRSGRSARMDTYADASGPLADRLRDMGIRSRVGAPIVVDERRWGVAVVGSSRPQPLPADTEERISEFADLVATAIAAATTRADLITSRARIVAAADDARRRIERDLHDGAQQRLVSLGLRLRMVEDIVPGELDEFRRELSDVVSGLNQVGQELQEISRGIHPAVLSRGGLAPAFKTLARRSAVPVTLDVAIERRLPDAVEITAYYVVAEALANATKHAQASEVSVHARATEAELKLSIRDDGVGGVDPSKGSGLIGLKDRVEVLGGQLGITSTPESGTALHITIPLTA